MRKFRLIIFLLFLITLAGCSHKDVTKYYHDYEGESEHWEVYYHEKSIVTFWTEDGTLQHDSVTEATFTAVYKNSVDVLAHVRQLEVGYDTGNGGSSMCEIYDEDGPDRRAFTINSSSGFVTYEAETMTATLRIDDQIEIIELTKKSKWNIFSNDD
jgi:hypothetical protein